MSDTSTKRAEELAAWNGREAASLRRSSSPSIPEIAEMIEETAALLRALAAERDALRAALKEARRAALEEAASQVDDVHQWDGRDEYCENCKGGAVYPDARDVSAIIRALGEKE